MTRVSRQPHKSQMKCNVTIQTADALKAIGDLSDLVPHVEVAQIQFQEMGIGLFRLP